MHGLLQAYSRTNRILNSIKDCGNIICFRNLEDATNESFALFGDKDAAGVILMRPFNDYYFGYEDEKGKHVHGYKEIAEALITKYALPINPMTFTLEQKKEFVKLFGGLLKMQNLLSAFDEFTEDKVIVSPFDQQDYLTWYNDLHDEMRQQKGGENQSIEDDVVFEMELVKQIQINIPYILLLIKEYHDDNCQDKTIIARIQKAIGSSPDMRDKKDLIMKFIEKMTPTPGETPSPESDIDTEWNDYVVDQREEELALIIAEERLKPMETRQFLNQALMEGYVSATGLAITKILPPIPLFAKGENSREVKKTRVYGKLNAFFIKYYGLTTERFGMVLERGVIRNIAHDEKMKERVDNMMKMDGGTSLLALARECAEEFGSTYYNMRQSDWYRLVKSYVEPRIKIYDLLPDQSFQWKVAEDIG